MPEHTPVNDWCRPLGIATPTLETMRHHPAANTYSLLLVALLERGEPMTLDEVAERFEQACIAERSRALLSLKKCKPARPPVYREGDLYHLDPRHEELDLWAFRLGLRPPRVPPPEKKIDERPLPGPDVALTSADVDEAWKNADLFSWSSQRLALAVLDAHGGPLSPAQVIAHVSSRSTSHDLKAEEPGFRRSNSALEVLDDGRWDIRADAGELLTKTRVFVRERVALARRDAVLRPDPVVLQQRQAAWARQRAAHGALLAKLSRALLVAFPPKKPQAVALLDVDAHELTTFVGEELAALKPRLAAYEILGAVDVRTLLRALDFEPGDRRLAELGPPQKTLSLNRSGRTLKLTTALLVQGSCGISRPFGDPAMLARYLADGELTKLRRRLEADVKSLYALHEYGRLHGTVRLRWGFLDERLPAPWVHRDEPTFYELRKGALAGSALLEVVVGAAPGWSEPWSRAQLVRVREGDLRGEMLLIDEDGYVVDPDDVQRARLAVAVH